MRVMTAVQIEALCDRVRAFAYSVKDRLIEPAQMRWTLNAQNLLGEHFEQNNTVLFKR